MGTKERLRMVLRVLGMVFVVILSLGSICKNDKENPAGPGVEGASIEVEAVGGGWKYPPGGTYHFNGGNKVKAKGDHYSISQIFSIKNVGKEKLIFSFEEPTNGLFHLQTTGFTGANYCADYYITGSNPASFALEGSPYGGWGGFQYCKFEVYFYYPGSCEDKNFLALLKIWSNDPQHPEISFLMELHTAAVEDCVYGEEPVPDTGTGTKRGN